MGLQEFTVDVKGCERQWDCLEVSLIYNKSDKHLTICCSYNAECAAKMTKSIELANSSDAFSTTNIIKFDTWNDTQKHMWKQYVAWHGDVYSAAPIYDYVNKSVFQ